MKYGKFGISLLAALAVISTLSLSGCQEQLPSVSNNDISDPIESSTVESNATESSMAESSMTESSTSESTKPTDTFPTVDPSKPGTDLSVEEVKTIFDPLLKKAYSIEFGFMFCGTMGKSATAIPKGTVVQCGDTTISLPYEYTLVDHPASPFYSFHSIEEIHAFTEEAYTEECADRAYYSRFLDDDTPKFVEYEGKLYSDNSDGTGATICELDTLRILKQQEDYILVEFVCLLGPDEIPEPGILSVKKTEDGWRLDRAVPDATNIEAFYP